jgi:hypothetical protein
MKRFVAVLDTLIALALVAWVGGHAALGAFAARIVFRDLPRPLAASTMSTIFSSFDTLIGVMAALVLGCTLARLVALREKRADQLIAVAGILIAALGLFEIVYVNRHILEMFHAGRTLEPAFGSLHRLSERCGHLEVLLAAVIFAAQSWSRAGG